MRNAMYQRERRWLCFVEIHQRCDEKRDIRANANEMDNSLVYRMRQVRVSNRGRTLISWLSQNTNINSELPSGAVCAFL